MMDGAVSPKKDFSELGRNTWHFKESVSLPMGVRRFYWVFLGKEVGAPDDFWRCRYIIKY